MTAPDIHRAIDAVWRIEAAKLIAGLARMVRDVGRAEELAQDALVIALERWPATGIPDNPGAWLMATAKRRAIDLLRRGKMLARKHAELGRELEIDQETAVPDLDAAIDEPIGDDLLSLIFTACHPVLSTEARVALTLRLLGGLTTEEIARAFLVAEPTDRPADRAGQADPRRGRGPLRGAARGRARRAPVVGARGHLPDLQRRLFGHRRRRLDAAAALRGGAAARPHPGRPGAATSRRSTAWWR